MDSIDWRKIAIEAVAAMHECCGCSIDGADATYYLNDHLTESERNALITALADKLNYPPFRGHSLG